LLPEDQRLLTDQQLRDASEEQLQDLIAVSTCYCGARDIRGSRFTPQKTRSLRIPPTRALSSSGNA
jgi:hypothetical protein